MLERLFAGKRIRVYRNLNRNCLSVTYRGKVVGYIDEIQLEGVRFVVSQAGRRRAVAERRRNVHARVEGTLAVWCSRKPRKRCTYNPFRYESFVARSNAQPIYFARSCRVSTTEGLYVA